MATAPTAEEALTAAVGALGARFVLHWGEMGARWGVSRTVSQIHALLFLLGRPMHAEEISEALQVARSNVSTSLRELQNWDLVKVVHLAGDRRDHFATAQDPWDLLHVIVRERGHAVLIGTRHPRRALARLPAGLRDCELRETHFESLTTRYVWQPLLAGVEAVVNADRGPLHQLPEGDVASRVDGVRPEDH